jgi:hypothetical protein
VDDDVDRIALRLQQGRQAFLELVEQERAVFWPEVQAKIADRAWPTLPNIVDPHHLTTLRRNLIDNEEILEEVVGPTRGGHLQTVIGFRDRASRTGGMRAFEDAAGRKRLLAARYHSWGRASAGHPNIIGPAGERITRASLLAVSGGRYTPLTPNAGEVTHLFGAQIDGGSFDTGAHLILTDALGRPTGSVVTVLVEVKNVRHWIYPDSAELYDLLDRAARLQTRHENYPFVPVLVCRKAHSITFKMAEQLGFFIFDTHAQFLSSVQDLKPEHVEEVRYELGFNDLVLIGVDQPTPSPSMRRRFETVIPSVAARTAARFARSAPVLVNFASTLRNDTLDPEVRDDVYQQLRAAATELPDFNGGW